MLQKPKKLGIIGKGKMGRDIFNYLMPYDYSIVWICRKEKDKKELKRIFDKKLQRKLKRGDIDNSTFNTKKKNVIISSYLEDVALCDIIIESITEDLQMKKDLFAYISSLVNRQCILTTNTSSISLAKILEEYEWKQRVAGLHFFYPIKFKNIVEINTTSYCNAETIATLKQFLHDIDRRHVILPESDNFILNKILADVQAQAYRIHEENILSIQEIDEMLKDYLFPVGVFEMMDSVGLNTILISIKNYCEKKPDKNFYTPWINSMENLVSHGYTGIKHGQGFYIYRNGKKRCIPGDRNRLHDESVREYKKRALDKLTAIYLNAVFKVINKRYCTAEEIDYAVKEYMGTEKGPLALALDIGYDRLFAKLSEYYKQTGEQVYAPSPAIKRNNSKITYQK
jgi:3-hydroxybutyryl-CoA dehydrogenase